MDEVFGLVTSGLPPSNASPSACKIMNDDRAVANDSASAFPVPGRPVLRTLVNERVRGSGDDTCHTFTPRVVPSVVGLASGVLKGLVLETELRRAAERIEPFRPRVPLPDREERFENVLLSLRFDPVRSDDFVGETRPWLFGLEFVGR